jgi:hypothetical protein
MRNWMKFVVIAPLIVLVVAVALALAITGYSGSRP